MTGSQGVPTGKKVAPWDFSFLQTVIDSIQIRSLTFKLINSWAYQVSRNNQDMNSYFLEPPIYEVLNHNTVRLTLKNNIAARSVRKLETSIGYWSQQWDKMNLLEKEIIYYISNVYHCTPKQLMELTGRTRPTLNKHIKVLSERGIIREHSASLSDPTKYYELVSTLKAP